MNLKVYLDLVYSGTLVQKFNLFHTSRENGCITVGHDE